MITYDEVKAGIIDAWSKLNTAATFGDDRCMVDLLERSRASGGEDSGSARALCMLTAALAVDGWQVSLNANEPEWGHVPADTAGITNHCERRILLKDGPSSSLLRILAHEVGHAWGDISNGNQVCKHANPSEERRKERAADDFFAGIYGEHPAWKVENEAEAELTAAIVSSALGMDASHAFYYLAWYRQKGWRGAEHFDEDVLPRAWASAERIAARILAALEERAAA